MQHRKDAADAAKQKITEHATAVGGNGGGRGCTSGFFTYRCRRLFPQMWDAANCGMRIDAHGYDGIEKRLHNTVALPEARIAGDGDGPVDSDYDVRPPADGGHNTTRGASSTRAR